MLTLITLPENFVSGITANTSSLFTDFAPLLQLILGVLLTGTLIAIIIGAIKK
jgi:NADH:ubiquinone oxidoreductase subunit 6 (subunit J)